MRTLKERLEQLNELIIDCEGSVNVAVSQTFTELYPSLLNAVELEEAYDKSFEKFKKKQQPPEPLVCSGCGMEAYSTVDNWVSVLGKPRHMKTVCDNYDPIGGYERHREICGEAVPLSKYKELKDPERMVCSGCGTPLGLYNVSDFWVTHKGVSTHKYYKDGRICGTAIPLSQYKKGEKK